jgi:hypothetical protein
MQLQWCVMLQGCAQLLRSLHSVHVRQHLLPDHFPRLLALRRSQLVLQVDLLRIAYDATSRVLRPHHDAADTNNP